MYEQFFGFHTKPFDLLPNPDLLYRSSTHAKALTHLKYGIQERSGFILLTGEVGAGKTTLLRELIKHELGDVTIAKVFNTRVDSLQLLAMINDDFGLETQGKDKVALIKDLNAFLIDEYAAGRRVILIIDEAQNLSLELLEEVRMLSNLETEMGKLLQIILSGQPELNDSLARPELLQLRQRIQVRCHLSPFSRKEVQEYILYRMERAGNGDAITLSDGAYDAITRYTRGIPRLINILCDYILLDACVNGRTSVTEDDVTGISSELQFEQQYWQAEGASSAPASAPVRPAGRSKLKTMVPKAQRVLQVIQDLDSRIELLERAAATRPAAEVQLLERIERLEGRLRDQEDRINGTMAMWRNTVAQQQISPIMAAPPAGRPRPRSNWFKRFFLGDE